MSVQAISWLLDHSESRLAARHVLISIANHCDKYGCNAFPSVATIASEAKLSDRQVQRCLPELEELGELQIEKGVGPGGTNLYSLPKMGGDNLSHLDPVKEVVKTHENVTGWVTNRTEKGDKSVGAIRKNRPEPSINRKNITPDGALMKKWLTIKATLADQLPDDEAKLWVRQLYLLKLMSGEQLLLTLPPNSRIIEAAQARSNLIRAAVQAAGFKGFSLARYPDDYELERVGKQFPELADQFLGFRKRAARTASAAPAELAETTIVRSYGEIASPRRDERL